MSKTYYDPADLEKFGGIAEYQPELARKFFDYYGGVFKEGALTEREKALIALAVSHARIVLISIRSDHWKKEQMKSR